MKIQTIKITPNSKMTKTELMSQVNSLIPSSVQSFIDQCYINRTLTAEFLFDDVNNSLDIVRQWDPDVVPDYKAISSMDDFKSGITSLGWTISISPDNVDL